MKKYYDLYESPSMKDRYILCLDVSELPEAKTYGSFIGLAVRLTGLSYANFYRYCRDKLGANISGKGSYLLSVNFQKNKETLDFVDELNRRISILKGENV